MPTGTVKFFNDQKGFGFITRDDAGDDIFVHRSNIRTHDRRLMDNQRVKFEIGTGRKGPEAREVQPI